LAAKEEQSEYIEYPVIVGESKGVQLVRQKIEKVADKNVTAEPSEVLPFEIFI